MNGRFRKYLRNVGVCHVGILVLMLTTSGWTSIFNRTPDSMPQVDFTVEMMGEPIKNKIPDLEPISSAEPDEPKEPTPDSVKVDPLPVKKKSGVEVSKKKITRVKNAGGGGGAKKTTLTKEELRRFLAMGAKPSDHTSIPGDEQVRCFEIVRRTMYEAWNQPGVEDAANAVAEVTIGLSRDGMVLWRKMSKKSGNSVFDDSIMLGVNSVQYVEHLTPAFLDKYREIKITFKLD